MSRRHRPARGHRRGVALLIAIVAMALTAAMMISLAQTLTTESRVVDQQAQQLQRELLVDAAVSRTAAQLATNEEFSGESWELPRSANMTPEASSRRAGIARIETTLVPEEEGQPSRVTVRLLREDGTPWTTRTREIHSARASL